MNKLVSIIIPAYKSGQYLLEALHTVLIQDYSDIQIIICDDGTCGFNRTEIDYLVHRERPKVLYTVIHQAKNIGTVKNINVGLKYAVGEWVLLLAADDQLYKQDAISKLVKQSVEMNAPWIIPQTKLCDSKMNDLLKIDPCSMLQDIIKQDNQKELYYRLCLGCCIPSSGTLYSRELLVKYNGFNENYKLVEDWPMFITLVRDEIMPKISHEVTVYHRDGGTSSKWAGKNFVYQNDLIKIMTTEIVPNISILSFDRQQIVLQNIEEKAKIFDFRFGEKTLFSKLVWLFKNSDIIRRRIKNYTEL